MKNTSLTSLAGLYLMLLSHMIAAVPVAAQSEGPRMLPSFDIEKKIDEQAKLIEANAEHLRRTEAAIKEMQLTLERLATVKVKAAEGAGGSSDVSNSAIASIQQSQIKKRLNELQKWQELEESMEAKRMRQVKENFRELQVWDVSIRNALTKYRTGIHSGDLLNRLFSQIESSTGLSSASTVSPGVAAGLKILDEKDLKALTLNIQSINGQVSVSLAGRLPPALENWPYLFSAPELRIHVAAFNESFALFRQLPSGERFDAEQNLLMTLERATAALQRKYPPATRRSLDQITMRRVHHAERFLEDLTRNLATMAEEGEYFQRESFFSCYTEDQRNVASLIQYMTKYGLTFSPARQGQQTFYDRLFREAYSLSQQLNAAPTRESITEPIINLDLDAMVRDPGDP